MHAVKVTPGEPAPFSGPFVEVGPSLERGREITAVAGQRMPPTTMPGAHYEPSEPQRAVSRWENEGGASSPSARSAGAEPH